MAETPARTRRLLRFSSFELDPESGELRKAGDLVGLQEQSLRVLLTLLEHPGVLVTREQLRQRLWPDGTFVDFEHGLNAVINRLRDALGDSAESPSFIQTVPRRGYRFLATIEEKAQPPDEMARGAADREPASPRWHAPPERIGPGTAIPIAGLVLGVAATVLLLRAPAVDSQPLRAVPLTRLAGRESAPAFAPDGEQVAFVWSGEKSDNVDIYVTLVGSTSVRRLTTDSADDFGPSWSPDGRRIAFLRRSGHSARVHITSAVGGPDLKLSDFPVGVVEADRIFGAQIAWSPDGRQIVAGRDPRASEGVSAGLYLIPVDGGEPRALTRPTHPAFDLAPAFSANGRRLAYLACRSIGPFLPSLWPGECVVRATDLDDAGMPKTAPRTLTMDPVEPLGLAWSRDGASIIYTSGHPGPVRLWRLWINASRPAELIEMAGEAAEYPATAVTRDRLAFSQVTWDAHLYRFTAGQPAEEVASSSSYETDPDFSPDGRRLAFASGRSGKTELWVAAADGSNPRQLTDNVRNWPGSPSWSPDGRSIAFDSGERGGHTRIWIIDADGGTARAITEGPGNQSVPRWSRDGKWIYFSNDGGGSREIWRVAPIGGTPEQITRTGSGFVGYEFSNGTSLLYQPTHGDSALLLTSLSGRATPRRLVDCVRTAAFAAFERTVLYVPCDSSSRPPLRSIDTISGKDRLLGQLEAVPPGGMHVNLAVSPDGETILFRGVLGRSGDVTVIENFR